MKFRTLSILSFCGAAALSVGLVAAALAADAPKPAAEVPPPTSQVPLALTVAEAQLAGVALGNAGTACDAGVQVYCQVLQLRGSLVGKLSDGLRAAQAQPPKAPAK